MFQTSYVKTNRQTFIYRKDVIIFNLVNLPLKGLSTKFEVKHMLNYYTNCIGKS